jgi:hypothetical protein
MQAIVVAPMAKLFQRGGRFRGGATRQVRDELLGEKAANETLRQGLDQRQNGRRRSG